MSVIVPRGTKTITPFIGAQLQHQHRSVRLTDTVLHDKLFYLTLCTRQWRVQSLEETRQDGIRSIQSMQSQPQIICCRPQDIEPNMSMSTF